MARDAAPVIRAAAVWLAAAAALLAACSGRAAGDPAQFVGKWKSSRLATPLHLYPNGEWEIRADDDRVLQYGVWQLQDRRIVWTVKVDGRVDHDENAVLAVGPRRFELRERDGSVTVFERLDASGAP